MGGRTRAQPPLQGRMGPGRPSPPRPAAPPPSQPRLQHSRPCDHGQGPSAPTHPGHAPLRRQRRGRQHAAAAPVQRGADALDPVDLGGGVAAHPGLGAEAGAAALVLSADPGPGPRLGADHGLAHPAPPSSCEFKLCWRYRTPSIDARHPATAWRLAPSACTGRSQPHLAATSPPASGGPAGRRSTAWRRAARPRRRCCTCRRATRRRCWTSTPTAPRL
eukprot:COSAG04_NODE_890_length_9608_cov_2.919234_2_plen_219_part_00